MIKRVISIIITLTFLICGANVYAAGEPSSWAIKEIEKSEKYGFNSENFEFYNEPITRGELCKIILNVYNLVSETEYSVKLKSPFPDAEDEEIIALYELGIVSGLGDGLFEPGRGVTRQEIAKFLSLLYTSASGERNIMVDEESLKKFTDYEEIGTWAYPYIAFLIDQGILNGYDDGSFKPQNEVTVEQAIVLAVRIYENMKGISDVEDEITENSYIRDVKIESIDEKGVSVSTDGKKAIIKLGKAGHYNISVTEQRNSYYEDAIEARPYIEDTVDAGEYSFEINPTRIYRVSVSGGGYAKFVTARPDSAANRAEIDSFGEITTKEEADALQTEIEIPIWRLSNGERKPGTARLIVHTAIADRVKAVFEEIYAGEEKFPIIDIGGYAWRDPMGSGRLSEHNLGTAIDINADQNYCLYLDGSAVGSYWKPYDDPFSITPYGEVINIFEKHGFTWGGDAWRSPNDYMHFSYLGT